MGFIFGSVGVKKSSNFSTKYESLKSNLFWDDSTLFEIEVNDFNGGVFYNTSHPLETEDLFLLDKAQQILIIFDGFIYSIDSGIKGFDGSKISKSPLLILKLYLNFGQDFINYLNGDFSIFLYDIKKGQIYLFRDHLGIRPMCFSYENNLFWFSSDYMGLSKALYSRERINPKYIYNQLLLYGIPSSSISLDYLMTPSEKVFKVLPGHFVVYNKENHKQIKYWFPENLKVNNKLSFDTALKTLDLLLKDAITIRCDKRFKASSNLSGGIDSSAVAILTKKYYEKIQPYFYGFSWTSDKRYDNDMEFDERELIKSICKKYNIIPIWTELSSNPFNKYIKNWRFVTDLIIEQSCRQKAKELKVNLLFSGWGGDEFISYHNHGIDSDLFLRFKWRLFFKKNNFRNPKKLAYALVKNVLLQNLGIKYGFVKSLHKESKYLKKITDIKWNNLNEVFSKNSPHKVQLAFLKYHHLSERAEDLCINGYRDNVEYRYPLLDKRIIEYVLQMPSNLFFKDGYGRIMMRLIGKDLLPESVRLNQSKLDPVRFFETDRLWRNLAEKYFDEIDNFKANQELSFIDFEKLIKDYYKYKDSDKKNKMEDINNMIIAAKRIHEITKGYYGNFSK